MPRATALVTYDPDVENAAKLPLHTVEHTRAMRVTPHGARKDSAACEAMRGYYILSGTRRAAVALENGDYVAAALYDGHFGRISQRMMPWYTAGTAAISTRLGWRLNTCDVGGLAAKSVWAKVGWPRECSHETMRPAHAVAIRLALPPHYTYAARVSLSPPRKFSWWYRQLRIGGCWAMTEPQRSRFRRRCFAATSAAARESLLRKIRPSAVESGAQRRTRPHVSVQSARHSRRHDLTIPPNGVRPPADAGERLDQHVG